MNENIQMNKEEENKIMEFEDNKTCISIPKNKLFISKKLKNSEKDNQYTKKRYVHFISFKKPYFKVENKSIVYKKNIYIILILMTEDGLKKKVIDLYKELLYMELIGEKSKL